MTPRGFILDTVISLRFVTPSWRALFTPDEDVAAPWPSRDRIADAARASVRAMRALGAWVAGPP